MLRLLLFAASAIAAQTPEPVGTWRGTSICAPGHPACHDETVVYRVRAAGERFEIAASKIVNGQEEFMGNIACDFAPAMHTLNCPTGYGHWCFTLSGRMMTGTLVVRNELFRNVSVARATS